jgi:hypothetical protein
VKYPKVAAVLFFVAIGAFALAVFGENMRTIFLAVGILCLLLSYTANRRSSNRLIVDPFTSQQIDAVGIPNDIDE